MHPALPPAGQAPPTAAATRATPPRVPRHGVADILRLTWPVVLSQLMTGGVHIVDIFMLGRLGTDTLAAVGYATQFHFLVQACLIATGAACVAMMSRAIGSGDSGRARAAFAATLTLGLGCACTLGGLGVAAPELLLSLLAVPPQVVALAAPYFRLTLGSTPLLAIILLHEHAFRATRNTLRPMLLVAAVSCAKIGLNLVLIFGGFGVPALGLAGAGWATVGSQALGALLFIAAGRGAHHPALRLSPSVLPQMRALLGQAMRIAGPAVGERAVLTLAMLIFFRFLGGYGVAAVAAYNVGIRILSFTWIPGVALSVAAGTLVGQALGAGDGRAARAAGSRAVALGTGLALVLGVVFVGARAPLAAVFTDDPAVLDKLGPFIVMLGCGLPFLVGHFTLSGALRGAGDTMTPLRAAVLGNWLFRVPLGYLFAVVLQLDLLWIWSLMLMDHISRAGWLLWAFFRGDWDRRTGTDPGAPAGQDNHAATQ